MSPEVFFCSSRRGVLPLLSWRVSSHGSQFSMNSSSEVPNVMSSNRAKTAKTGALPIVNSTPRTAVVWVISQSSKRWSPAPNHRLQSSKEKLFQLGSRGPLSPLGLPLDHSLLQASTCSGMGTSPGAVGGSLHLPCIPRMDPHGLWVDLCILTDPHGLRGHSCFTVAFTTA